MKGSFLHNTNNFYRKIILKIIFNVLPIVLFFTITGQCEYWNSCHCSGFMNALICCQITNLPLHIAANAFTDGRL